MSVFYLRVSGVFISNIEKYRSTTAALNIFKSNVAFNREAIFLFKSIVGFIREGEGLCVVLTVVVWICLCDGVLGIATYLVSVNISGWLASV